MVMRSLTVQPLSSLLLLASFCTHAFAQGAPPAAPARDPALDRGPAIEATAPTRSANAAPEAVAFEAELASFVQPGALTSNEVAERAQQRSPRLEAKEEAVNTAQAQADAVLGQFYPKLTGRASYTRLSPITLPPALASIFPVILDQWALTASLNIPVSDYILRLSTALNGAGKNKQSAELNARAERLLVQTDAKLAYYNWVKAKGSLHVANKSKEQVDATLADVKQAFAMGTASKADVMRSEAQVFAGELLKVRAEQAVTVSTEALRSIMHDSTGREYFVGEDILADVEEPPVTSVEQAYNEAKASRLELRALTALEEATVDKATLAKVAYYPRLDVFGSATYANPNQRLFFLPPAWRETWDVGVALTWTPSDIPMTMGEVATASSQAAQIAAQRRQLEDGLKVEVEQAVTEMKAALVAVATSRQALQSSEEGYRVRSELFKAGRATTLEVTDAQALLTRARLELVFAHADAQIAKAKLLHVLGRDIQGQK